MCDKWDRDVLNDNSSEFVPHFINQNSAIALWCEASITTIECVQHAEKITARSLPDVSYLESQQKQISIHKSHYNYTFTPTIVNIIF